MTTHTPQRASSLSELIEHYRAIATILARQPDTLPRLLAADYRFVAELLVLAIRRGTVAMLVAARTIERVETKKP